MSQLVKAKKDSEINAEYKQRTTINKKHNKK